MKVTREMLSAAHGVTLPHGIVLDWKILEKIYLAMKAKDSTAKERKPE